LILKRPQKKLKLPKSKEGSKGKKGKEKLGMGSGIGGNPGIGGRGIEIAGNVKAKEGRNIGGRQNKLRVGSPRKKGNAGRDNVGN
jgi:hypothetical protein